MTSAGSSERASRKFVVAGLVIDGSRVLITKRSATQSMPHKWEFPGGKVEAGESPEEALVRELAEEIGVTVEVSGIWEVLFHRYPNFDLLMLVYPCRIPTGQSPQCCEVADLAWVEPTQMPNYDILEADAPLVLRLLREGPPR